MSLRLIARETADGYVIHGERDALVTLRSAINEALRQGHGTADLEDLVTGQDILVLVRKEGA